MQARLQSMPTKKNEHFFYCLILTLSSFGFFRPLIVEPTSSLFSYVYGLLLFLSVPAVFSFFVSKKQYLLSGPFKLLLTAIILSIFSATIFWYQDITQSVLASLLPISGYIFYFYLVENNVSTSTIERVILICGLLYIFVFLLSFIIYPAALFNNLDFGEDRGFVRIFISGDGFIYLTFFMCLNFFKTTRKKRWALIAAVAFLCIVLNLTRVYIISCTLIAVLYIVTIKSIWIRIGVGVAIVAGVIIVPQLEFVQNLTSTTQDQFLKMQDYIRFKAAGYFLTDFQPSPLTHVIGNGFSYGDKSEYGKTVTNLASYKEYFIEDIGFIGLYIHLGIIGIIAYVTIFYRALRIKLSVRSTYLKMFLYFLLFAGLTSSLTFNSSSVFSIVLAFYLVERANTERIIAHEETLAAQIKNPIFS